MKSIRTWRYIAIISLFLFVLTGLAVYLNLFTPFDDTVTKFIQTWESSLLTTAFITFTNIGSFIGTIAVYLILFYLFWKFNWRTEAVLLTGVTLSTPIINLVLKEFIQRPRPELSQLIEIAGYSFPSGHTMYAVSLYGITLTLVWFKLKSVVERIFLTFLISLIIITIAISRIYLGVHYPSDIIGGIFMSNFIISLTFYIYLTVRKQEK